MIPAAATNSQVTAASDTDAPDSHCISVNNVHHSGGLSNRALAVAVLIFLIVLAALGVYVKISRGKKLKKRQRWNQAVNKRVAIISGDRKAIAPAGASAAIRQSMAPSGGDPGTKAPSFFTGYGPSPVR